jgi:lipoprotein signal peptidase
MAVGVVLAVLVLAADQGSKYWVLNTLNLPVRGDVPVLPPFLDLAMVWNNGVTFGLLKAGHRSGQLLLSAVAVAVVGGLFLWLRRAENLLVAASIGAIAGGALGNVADRYRLGTGLRSTRFRSSSTSAIRRSWWVLAPCCWKAFCRPALWGVFAVTAACRRHPRKRR